MCQWLNHSEHWTVEMAGEEHKAMPLMHLISPMPQASLNGDVLQHITTVLEPRAGNYTGI